MAKKIPVRKTVRVRTPFNPCSCWALKDGAITVGIWTTLCAILQLGLFAWQMSVVGREKDRASNARAQWYGTLSRYDNRYPGYYEQYYQTPEERFFLGLFIIQILHLIADLFLLLTGIALIAGITRPSRYLVWPYFPSVLVTMICSITYCAMWLSSPSSPSDPEAMQTVRSTRERMPYWSVLLAVILVSFLINLYCFIVIISAYQHIKRRILKNTGYYLKAMPPKNPDWFQPELESAPAASAGGKPKPDDSLYAAKLQTTANVAPELPTKQPPAPITTTAQLFTGYPNPMFQTSPVLQPVIIGGYPYQGGQLTAPIYMTTPAPPPIPPKAEEDAKIPPYKPPEYTKADAGDHSSVVKEDFTKHWLQGVQPPTEKGEPKIIAPPTEELLKGGTSSTIGKSEDRRRRHKKRRKKPRDTYSEASTQTSPGRRVRSRSARSSRSARGSRSRRGSSSRSSSSCSGSSRSCSTCSGSPDRSSLRSRSSRRSCRSCGQTVEGSCSQSRTCTSATSRSSRRSRSQRSRHSYSHSDTEIVTDTDTGYSDYIAGRNGGRRHSSRKEGSKRGSRPYSSERTRRPRDVKKTDYRRQHRVAGEPTGAPPPRPPKPSTGFYSTTTTGPSSGEDKPPPYNSYYSRGQQGVKGPTAQVHNAAPYGHLKYAQKQLQKSPAKTATEAKYRSPQKTFGATAV